MKTIDVTPSQLEALSRRIKSASQQLQDIRTKTESYRNCLNMETAAKDLIDAKLYSASGKMKLTIEHLDRLSGISSYAAEEYRNADKESSAKTDEILKGFSNPFMPFVSSVNGAIIANRIHLYLQLTGMFLANFVGQLIQIPSSSINSNSTINGGFTQWEVNYVPTNNEAGNETTNKKKYTNSSLNLDGNDYSDFVVTHDIDLSLFVDEKGPVFNQHRYSELHLKGKTKNDGCTATADAVLATLVLGKFKNPIDGWSQDGGATWPNTKSIPGTSNYKNPGTITKEEYLKRAAEQLENNNPVLIRVTNTTKTVEDGHTVCAIGIREGKTSANAGLEDILVVDPADGKVKTLFDACKKQTKDRKGNKLVEGDGELNVWPYYALRIADMTNMKK